MSGDGQQGDALQRALAVGAEVMAVAPVSSLWGKALDEPYPMTATPASQPAPEPHWYGVKFSEEEMLALAAALDGNRPPGHLGSAIEKVREAAMSIVYGSSSRVARGAGER